MSAADSFGFPIARTWAEINASDMRLIDEMMVDAVHVSLLQMMENAGRALAALARVRFLAGDAGGRRVMVLAGAGGNGGGAMVAARRLANWGAEVRVVLARPVGEIHGVPAHQLNILERMGVPVDDAVCGAFDLIIDGLVGYSLTGRPRGRSAELIALVNANAAPVLSLDVPSGFDATRGTVTDTVVEASATLTLAQPKLGLVADILARSVGALYLADISVPPDLYWQLPKPISAPSFSGGDIVRLLRESEVP